MDNQEMMNQIAGMFKEQTEIMLGLGVKIDDVKKELKADIGELKADIKGIDNRLSKVELTIEHEIRDNIQILVEGQKTILHQQTDLSKRVEKLEAKQNLTVIK